MRSRFATLLLALLLAGTARGAQAQQRQVTGTVTGPDQAPIPSAQVVVTGSRRGVQTDGQGRFTITLPAGAASITASRIGYLSRTVPVAAGESSVQVRLQPDVLNLEAVVVTGQATAVKRQALAHDVAVVNSRQLVGNAPAQTLDRALQGKAAGGTARPPSRAPSGAR